MVLPKENAGDRAALRQVASDWFARMHGPDAERLRAEFERWQASDPRNRAAYARLEGHWDASAALRNTSLGRARQLPRKRSWLPGTGVAPRFALASAALCLALVVGGVAMKVRAPSVEVAAATMASGIGQIRTIHLPDGSSLTLDTNSVVTMAFTNTNRVIRLIRGRARFDVAHDIARPFVVEAAGRAITATGTLFDVAIFGSAVRVDLLRGAVYVRRGTAVQPLQGLVTHLSPGQSFTATGQGVPAVIASPKGVDGWASGMLSFDDASLSDVLDQTNRYSRETITLGDPDLASLKVTGAFRPTPASHLAASLAAAFSLRVEHRADGGYILHRR
jgi:transmembrane sensor